MESLAKKQFLAHNEIAQQYRREDHSIEVQDSFIIYKRYAGNCSYATVGFNSHPWSYTEFDKGDGRLLICLQPGSYLMSHTTRLAYTSLFFCM